MTRFDLAVLDELDQVADEARRMGWVEKKAAEGSSRIEWAVMEAG